MKKNFLTKVLCIMMVFSMMVGASVNAYAMDDTATNDGIENYATTAVSRSVVSYYNAGQMPWAETKDVYPGGFLVHNYTDIVVKAPSSDSTNKMCVKPHLKMYSGDPNQATLMITLTVIRSNGQSETILTFGVNSSMGYVNPQSGWFSVSKNETVTIRIDASTYYSSESTGTYRYADVEAFEVYSD